MDFKLGFIGAGNMGGAIIRGLARSADIKICAYDPGTEKLNALAADCGIEAVGSVSEVVTRSEYVLLAVKPQLVKSVVTEHREQLAGKCLISIAAGVTVKNLGKWSNGQAPVVRVMPNAPAMVGAGVFAICLDHHALTDAQRDDIQSFFAPLGDVHILKEDQFDAFTGLIGSGPAYAFYFMEGLIDAGVSFGFTRDQSSAMVKALVAGSARMSIDMDTHVTVLKEMVTSPGGTTIAGLNKLEKNAVKNALFEAVKAATKRSKELG